MLYIWDNVQIILTISYERSNSDHCNMSSADCLSEQMCYTGLYCTTRAVYMLYTIEKVTTIWCVIVKASDREVGLRGTPTQRKMFVY